MAPKLSSAIAIAAAGALTALAAHPAAAQERAPGKAACEGLAGAGGFADTTVKSAKLVEAAQGLPAYCEVEAVIQPVPGSQIGVVYRLPMDWNGKALGLGGGGWAGNVRLRTASQGLQKGYATLQTDAGHPNPNGTNADWSLSGPGKLNDAAVTDFSWRAIHLMTAVGKQVIAAYYGRPQSRAYFQGCSTGGRQGLMEAQRFPADYDGIVAGAPVYDFRVQTSAVMRVQDFHKDPRSNLVPEQLPLITKAVLDACDALDGVKDGVVGDPAQCKWDPAALACPTGQSGSTCLTPAQVETVRNAYKGYRNSGGQWVAFPLSRGGEGEWAARSIGDAKNPLGGNGATGSKAIQYFYYRDPNYDVNRWNPETEFAPLESSALAKEYEAKDPDIRPFLQRGGKLILWHGQYDPGPSYIGTTEYYRNVLKTSGASADVRLFLVPGVYHCGGGPGTDQFDMLAAMDSWFDAKTPPARVPASNAKTGVARPLCAYPAVARYRGQGDPKAAESFACAPPAGAEG